MQKNQPPEENGYDNLNDHNHEQHLCEVEQREERSPNGWKHVPWKRFIKQTPWGLVITLLRLLWLLIIWMIHHFGW